VDDPLHAVATAAAALPGALVRRDEPLARHLPLRCGGPARVWVEAADVDTVKAVLAAARAGGVSWRVLWPFQDSIAPDGGFDGLVLRPGVGFAEVRRLDDGGLRVGAAALWASLGAVWPAVGDWPGCAGGLFATGQAAVLGPALRQVVYLSGSRQRVVPVGPDGAPPPLPPRALLVAVVVDPAAPLAGRPRPLGTLFHDAAPVGRSVVPRAADAELVRAGLLGARLRDWRLPLERPGTVINRGQGTARELLVFAHGLQTRAEKAVGSVLPVRLTPIAAEPVRRPGPPA
jgi:hypothetical protein